MRLGDRFREAGISEGEADESSSASTSMGARFREEADDEAGSRAVAIDPLANLKRRASEGLFARLGDQLYDASLSKKQLHTFVVRELDAVLQEEEIPSTPTSAMHS